MRGQLYHEHFLIISPLHGHGEVANENPLILPRTLSIVGALVLLKRRAGKKNMRSPLLGLPKSIYYNDMPNRYNDHAHLSENVSHIFQVAVLSVSKK